MAASTPALAQGYGQVIGGMTSAAEQRWFAGGLVGSQFGVIDVNFEGGFMQDVLPKGLLNELTELQQGLPIKAEVILPTIYGMGNVRFITPGGRVHGFVGGGFGVARVKPKFRVTVGGLPFDLGDVFGIAPDPQVKPMFNVGGGLRFDVGLNGKLDVGYRHTTIFTEYQAELLSLTDVKVKLHTIYAAYGVRF